MSSQVSPSVPVSQPSPSEQLFQLAGGYAASTALYAVAKLGIPDLLASGPRSAAELAAATNANEDALFRVMRLLAGFGVFREVGLRYFALTAAGEPLRSGVPGSQREMVIWLADPFHHRVWADMLYTVKTGIPAVEKTTGMSCFDYMARDAEVFEEFNAAMTNFSSAITPAVLEAYDFNGIHTLVDVAGGHGFALGSVLRRYPQMHGILFDLERVVGKARNYLQEMGVADRCRAVGGDFFVEIPAGGDAYMMQHIIHDWNDERATLILKNARRALGANSAGKVLVLETVIGTGTPSPFASYLDIEMLLLPGGRERTEEEFRKLFAAAGLRLNRIVPTRDPMINVIEALPA